VDNDTTLQIRMSLVRLLDVSTRKRMLVKALMTNLRNNRTSNAQLMSQINEIINSQIMELEHLLDECHVAATQE
jgi:uracil phosphoribosyltransferase